MGLASRCVRGFGLWMGLLGLSACASVKVSVPGFSSDDDKATVALSERVALVDAANALKEQPWGEAPEISMVSFLFGNLKEDERDLVVKAYIADAAARSDSAFDTIMNDADNSLRMARRVAEAGRQAVYSISPVSSDIDMLEEAISEVRLCRDMYVKTLRQLDHEGYPVTRAHVRDVRDAFNQTITDIGLTADIVTARLRVEEPKGRFASHGNSQIASE